MSITAKLPRIILGIDPGSRVTGYGVIQSDGLQHQFLTCGCVRVTAKGLGERLHQVYAGVSQVIGQYAPMEVAVESVFMAYNPDTALKLGQARGVAIVAAIEKGLTFAEYSARQVKQSVVGHGAATKAQVQHMIRVLLKLNKIPSSDAADALAVAVCHSHASHNLAKLDAAQRMRHGRAR